MNQPSQKGLHLPDNFLATVKGFSRLWRFSRDSTVGFQSEIDGISNALFPLRDVPIPNMPGRVTHERDYFLVRHPDPSIKKIIEDHFFDRFTRRELYGAGHDLAGLFDFVVQHLLTEGRAYYVIEWEDKDIHDSVYRLPSNFRSLSGETVRKTHNGYIQQYSWYTYFFERQFKDWDRKRYKRTYRFNKDEILDFRYIERKTPVGDSIKFIPVFERFWQYGLNSSRAGAEPDNQMLSVERTRHTTYSHQKRIYNIAKAKVAKRFNYVATGVGSDYALTEFYDLYTVVRYKKFLNRLRKQLVEDFNLQVLNPVAEKNNLGNAPLLELRYVLTDEQIDEIFSQFITHQIDNQKCIELLIKP